MKKLYEKGNSDWYANAFSAFENSLNGQLGSEFHKKRQQAIKFFQETGFPTTKHEEWKYTSISPLLNQNFKLAQKDSTGNISAGDIEKFRLKDGDYPLLVFVNGYFNTELSDYKDLPAAIEILNLKEAIRHNHPMLEKHYAKYASLEKESFVSLNSAFVMDGTFIHIPDNQILDQPLQIIYLAAPAEEPLMNFPRNLIITGKSSQISFLETYAALSSGVYFTNMVSEIYVGENAHVERLKIQIENTDAFHVSNLSVEQERSSRFVDHNLNFGAGLSRNNISTRFNAEAGNAVLNGLYAGDNSQLMDNHTAIDHAFPHCESIELYKGILDNQARGVFNGKIFVQPDAQKTNAVQSNNCILLSDEATIDTKPQLEIFADDVKCTHGATVGQLDDDAYFYMRARGIDKVKAKKLLLYAFASEVMDKIENDEIRDRVAHLFEDKLVQVKIH
jgi:Fe-S cluster assembly protein SufD